MGGGGGAQSWDGVTGTKGLRYSRQYESMCDEGDDDDDRGGGGGGQVVVRLRSVAEKEMAVTAELDGAAYDMHGDNEVLFLLTRSSVFFQRTSHESLVKVASPGLDDAFQEPTEGPGRTITPEDLAGFELWRMSNAHT